MAIAKNIVVLFYPNPGGEYVCMPYPLLYLERNLRGTGVNIVIIDERYGEDLTTYLSVNAPHVLAIGFSVILGYQTERAAHYSRQIKSLYPEIPLVWGGAFVNWTPTTCIAEPFVDYIVTGQGEYALKELIEYFKGESVIKREDIIGLGFKSQDKIIHNNKQQFFNPYELPPLDYNLIDINNYVENGRLHYIASIGCTHFCNFCFVSQSWKGHCYSNTAQNIVDDIKYFLSVDSSIKYLALDDTNFFAHRDEVMSFCDLLTVQKININWCGTTRISEFLELYDDADLIRLRNAGCDTIYAGGESGDAAVLKHLNKKLTIEEIILFNQRVGNAGIKPSLSFMVLFPGEEDRDLRKTLQLIMQLKLDAPSMVFTVNAYIPMRKNIYYFKGKEMGYSFPLKMDDIIQGVNSGFVMPWHKKEYFRLLAHFSDFYFRFSNPLYYKEMPPAQQWFYRMINNLTYKTIKKRFGRKALGFRIDAVFYLSLIRFYGVFFKMKGRTIQKNYMTPRAKNF